MSNDSTDADRAPDEDDPFDLFMAECIEALESRGPDALEAILATEPEQAERARARLAALAKVGMLSLPDHDWKETIGPYEVIRRLGSGGMGEVVLAEHMETKVRVALKLGPIPQVSLTPDHDKQTHRANERFSREVQAVAGIRHPSIVPVLDSGRHKGRAWFATEFVDGVSLDRVLEAVRATDVLPEALTGRDIAAAVPGADENAFGATWVVVVGRIIREVAGALVEAHAAGVIHRDIKPSNILLRPDGGVQVVDFGLAHVEDMPTLTLSGEFAGTPYYVAPEQVENVRGGVDGRADVFSLGVTLYECASLRRPFTGQTPLEVLTAICGREPEPLRKVAPHLPVDLERLCRRALEKDPMHRYPTMQAFADDLGRLLEFRPLASAPLSPFQRSKRWARRRPWRAAFLGLAALLIISTPIVLLIANAKIRDQRDRVMDEAERSSLVVEHFVEHFNPTSGDPATDEAARMLLDRGALRLQYGLADDLRVRASLLHASARAYLQLGRPGDARPLLDRAFGLWLREGDAGSDDRARVLADLARVHLAENRPGLARDLATRALEEMSSGASGMEFKQRVMTTVAAANVELGDVALARNGLLELGVAEEIVRDDAAAVWESIGRLELERGDSVSARGALTKSLDLLQHAWAPNGERLANVHDALADTANRIEGASSPPAKEHRARAERLRSRPPGRTAAQLGDDAQAFPFLDEPIWAPAYIEASGRAVAALQAGRFDDSRKFFIEALDSRPSPAVAAYNLACCESLAGRIDEAGVWLDRARLLGFACFDQRLQSVERDPDIAALRASPAGQKVLRSMTQQFELAREYESRTVVVPATRPANAAEGWLPPLLVVVHDYGQTPADVATGPWAAIAEKLGATLLVPCGPYFVGESMAEGAAWSPDPRDLWGQPEPFGLPVLDQVRASLELGEVDLDRVWIGGRGQGAMLALDLLLENPGLFRNGWLIDPILHAKSGAASGHLPKVLGGRLAVSITATPPPAEALAKDAGAYAADVERWLKVAGDWQDSVRVVQQDAESADDLADWLVNH